MKNPDTLTRQRSKGYILQEIIVGVAIFGIAMVPVLRSLRLLPTVGSAISSQSRREAWRSVADQAVLEGIDPNQTAVMNVIAPRDGIPTLPGTISRTDLAAHAGGVQITGLSGTYGQTAEDREQPLGFEIGPGTIPVPPRQDPLPPLPPIQLTAPTLSPSNGTFVPAMALSPGSSPGGPYVLTIQATAAAATDSVRLQQSAPQLQSLSATGSAVLTVDAVQLASSVQGQTWTEYRGDPALDVPVSVDEFRTRWLVHVGTRTQVYEPSDLVTFRFGIDPGRPVYSVSGFEYPSGGSVAIDYATAVTIEGGRQSAFLTYPAEIRDRFGAQWAAIEPSFVWSFGSWPGDSSAGNTASLFSSTGRSRWSPTQTLVATPQSGLPGLRLLTGTWTIQRSSTVLQPPERVAAYYDGMTDAPSWMEFQAPALSGSSGRVGRPEVNGVESVTDSLSVLVVP